MGRKSFTKEEFVEKARKVHGDKYDYSKSEYYEKRKKVCIICPIHGEFWQNAGDHMKGSNCPKCIIDRRKSNLNDFIERANRVHNNKYDYSKVDYKTNKEKVCIICPIHGEFWQRPDKHLFAERGCSKCGGSNKLTKEEFIEKSIKIHGNKYDYSKVVYENHETKVCIICPKHGEFLQKANSHLNGNGCPICKSSKGELSIKKWLEENHISFIPQYRFQKCKDKKTLPFDFYLPDHNICIEYDGLQHFKPMGFSGSKSNILFEITKKHDKMRNDFCKNNNIRLIRIKYSENINERLLEIL